MNIRNDGHFNCIMDGYINKAWDNAYKSLTNQLEDGEDVPSLKDFEHIRQFFNYGLLWALDSLTLEEAEDYKSIY